MNDLRLMHTGAVTNSEDLLAPPPLNELSDERRANARREAIRDVLQVGLEKALRLESDDRAIWLAQLAAWTPSSSRSRFIDEALDAVVETSDPDRIRDKALVFTMLAPANSESRLMDCAQGLMDALPTDDSAWQFLFHVTSLFRLNLPPLVSLMDDLPNDKRRLEALSLSIYQTQESVLLQFLHDGLQFFVDPNVRASACVKILRRLTDSLEKGRLDEPTFQQVLDFGFEATDSVIANELFGWLHLASSESQAPRTYQAALKYNSDVSDPEECARGFFSAISLGLSADENAELAHRGLAAVQSVGDEALLVNLLGTYVGSIPGTPDWGLDTVLRIADGIEDQPLRAMAYGHMLYLDTVREEALARGLGLTDPWARASVVFGWQMNDPPRGLDRDRWNKIRMDSVWEIPQSAPRARYLTVLASESFGSTQHSLAQSAYEAARAVSNPAERVRAIYLLVTEGLIPRDEQTAALAAAWEIRAPIARYRALEKVAHLLGAEELAVLLERLLDDVVKNADRINFFSLCRTGDLNLGLAAYWWWHND